MTWDVLSRARPNEGGEVVLLGDEFAEMAGNQVVDLAEGRIRTVTFTCGRWTLGARQLRSPGDQGRGTTIAQLRDRVSSDT